jgi:hypothetical protein
MSAAFLLFVPWPIFFGELPVRPFIFHDGPLAEEVRAALDELQPQSRERARFCGPMRSQGPVNPTTLKPMPFIRERWALAIIKVDGLNDGWRAEVTIGMDLAVAPHGHASTATAWHESYRHQNGRTFLERGWIDYGR